MLWTGGCGIYCTACCCPCLVFGYNMSTLSNTECMFGGNQSLAALVYLLGACVGGLQVFVHCFGREAIRKKYSIPGDGFSDCCTALFCMPCALVQVSILTSTLRSSYKVFLLEYFLPFFETQEYNQTHGSDTAVSGQRFGCPLEPVTENSMKN